MQYINMATSKNKAMTFRFKPQIHEALDRVAKSQGRSMTNMLEWLVRTHCEREGLGWPPQAIKNGAATSDGEQIRLEGLAPAESVENPSN